MSAGKFSMKRVKSMAGKCKADGRTSVKSASVKKNTEVLDKRRNGKSSKP